jgi:Flp pilus assembly protein TadD
MRLARVAAITVMAMAAVASTQTADPDALVRQGRALFNQGKHDQAEQLYRQALALSPRSFEGAMALGVLLDLKGQCAEARTHLNRAIDVAPADIPRYQAMNALALSYAFDRMLAEAQEELEAIRRHQAIDGDTAGAAAAARAIGRIYLENGDSVNGRRWYELGYRESKPHAGQPESERLLWELRWHHAQARIASREGHLDVARNHLAEFESIMRRRGHETEDNDIHRWLTGYVAYYAKEYDRAIAELARGNLADPFILMMIGMSYQAKGDLENARAYYRRTLESNVHNLQAAIARPAARAKLASLR